MSAKIARLLPALMVLACIPPITASWAIASGPEVWASDIAEPSPVSGRRDAGFAYDSARDRLLVIGGSGGTGILYSLPLQSPAWGIVPIGSIVPTPTTDDRLFYDPVHDRAVLINANQAIYTLDLSTPSAPWLVFSPSHVPTGRTYSAMAYDALRNRVLMFGGGPTGGNRNDVWALSLSGTMDWSQITYNGNGPPARWGANAIYDAARDRLVIFGGSTSTGYTVTNDLWALPLSGTPTWSLLPQGAAGPAARMLGGSIYDIPRDRLVLFGGYPGALTDTWQYSFSAQTWAALAPDGTVPAGRWSLSAVFRSAVAQMAIFGGFNGGVAFNDVSTLDLGTSTSPPNVLGFLPTFGRVGDLITVTGTGLKDVTSVQFNGVEAQILATTPTSISTTVPAGATTGPIRVSAPLGVSTSSGTFYIGSPPTVSAAAPDSGRVGTAVVLTGQFLTGTTKVTVGNSAPEAFTVISDTEIHLTVDSLAVTGQVHVTTPFGTSADNVQFRVVADDPRPHILSVHDVKGDQGGRLLVEWKASDYDQSKYKTITSYRVWRRATLAEPFDATRPVPAGMMVRRVTLPDHTSGAEYWESLAEVPAAFLGGYAYAATTLQDSTSAGNPYTAFFVQALTADRYTFYNSNVDSSYSVDNLSPSTPSPFAATYAAGANTLHWVSNRAPDFATFELYRGPTTTFVPSPANRILAGSDTTFTDIAGAWSYKLFAVDVHGNHSHAALVTPQSPVAALASLYAVQTEADRIQLTWFASGNPGVTVNVYRRTVDSDWTLVALVTSDGDGFLHYTDTDVVSGTRYGYQLGLPDGGVEVRVGETWATAALPAVALAGIGPNPAHPTDLHVRFTLASEAPAQLALFDVTGRRVATREVGVLGPGAHEVNLAEGTRLEPGVYLVRFTQRELVRTARAVVVR